MKKLSIYISILLLSFAISCKKVLDIKPQNILSGDVILSSQSGVEAYMASLYDQLPIEDFNFRPNSGQPFTMWTHFTDESMNTFNYDLPNLGEGVSSQWWGYSSVRIVNDFIDKLPATDFDATLKTKWMGEAKFIRAYYYFAMVKRYGGVPLITTVQQFTGDNLDELKVPRNTEKEIYDFVAQELDSAALLLGPVTTDKSRANQYTAYALKCRAMLYAASIAKYGTLQLNGVVGIPPESANDYWQAAYDAARKIIDGGQYSLYEKNADKSQNFADLFLDVSNPEAIFVKYFKLPDKGHNYDQAAVPLSVRADGGYSSAIDPTLEFVEQFEYVDDPNGKLKLTDNSGNPIKYNNPTDLFLNKDPRFAGTIIYPFAEWRGNVIDVQAGLIHNGKVITTGDYNSLYDPVTNTIGNTGIRIIGSNGIGGNIIVSQTGFYIRKYLDPNHVVVPETAHLLGSSQQYIDIRYGEILLNLAEAAVELGRPQDALDAINEIRGRAGISLLDIPDITRDRVRHERAIELAFENHRYWDLRRWRIGSSVIPPNTKFRAILPYKDIDDNTYIFKTDQVGFAKTFDPKIYYERIPPDEISKDPKLVQNPFY